MNEVLPHSGSKGHSFRLVVHFHQHFKAGSRFELFILISFIDDVWVFKAPVRNFRLC